MLASTVILPHNIHFVDSKFIKILIAAAVSVTLVIVKKKDNT